MATTAKNGSSGKAAAGNGSQLEAFVKGQLGEAQKRIAGLEKEAEKVLKNLAARGADSRKELEGLLGRINSGEFNPLESARVRELGKKANQAGAEVKKRLDGLQTRVVEAVGVASQTQVKEINRELGKLSRKLDTLLGGKKPSAKSEPRA
ncbi:hypothetical protein FGE12_02125 [Aggregicoccus sp. 17bor-14]|uniref:hypothetical protein n=1 Tax=Myxococcaceae TaxID=31 RepID=UPI00129C8A4F|nr:MULTISPECIES: hypothetical protein [Myxococcaceae]MBF5041172.1 hypothetical protein [Simulacricoccus sp. 17bor-14]MRI86959.1 hypothetical protein [Aggregicoccus sp. 17bor-14]